MSRETLVFRASTAVLAAHALDDAVLHRQPGVPLDTHVPALLVALAVAAAACLLQPRLRAGLRAGLAALLGAAGLVNGAMHVAHVQVEGAAASDVSGVAAALAGAVLLALAVAVPFRARRGLRSGWRVRALALPGGLLALILVVAPLGMAIVDSHKWREPIPETPPGYEPVAFDAADGLRLRGWYHRSRNDATVLVVHGGNGDRRGSLAHARMLVRAGFGVLLFDARGRGESEGTPSGMGWGMPADVEGALAYLRGRPDVDPRRIAGLGISSGADALLEVARDHPELAAVVGDGAAAMTWEDGQRLGGPALESAAGWVMFQAIDLLTGAEKPRALEERVATMRAPLLLVSAGRAAEYDFNVRYARVAAGPTTHWNVPDVEHTRGLRERPTEYADRVGRFLADALDTRYVARSESYAAGAEDLGTRAASEVVYR